MLNLLASLTTPKKEVSQPTTTVKIQITPAGFTDGTVIFAFTVIFRTGTVFKKQ